MPAPRSMPGETRPRLAASAAIRIPAAQRGETPIASRAWSGFSLWGGSISFDTTTNWHYGVTTSGLASNELDFYSAATHEMGHILGIGTAPQWFNRVQGSNFVGSNAETVYGGAVPLYGDHAHWANGLTIGGQRASLDPVLNFGTRVTWSNLDEAALRDIGWAAGIMVSPQLRQRPAASGSAAGYAPARGRRCPAARAGIRCGRWQGLRLRTRKRRQPR